mmetsp:Transcript_7476/g.15551  ORF Transcript_7476/g.15551 Transcript_7476/m.15551 type:complete len:207 (-) Transcript_7476:1324-1944(-)
MLPKLISSLPLNTLTNGVTNMPTKFGLALRSSGQKYLMKLITSPLMWLPSGSWSVMIMILPYRRDLISSSDVYSLEKSRPTMVHRFLTSALALRTFLLVSRTLSTFPLSGNTPNSSLPTTSRPATARALAESPSVSTRVHLYPWSVPAQWASSSFGTLTPALRFTTSNCFLNLRLVFDSTTLLRCSMSSPLQSRLSLGCGMVRDDP